MRITTVMALPGVLHFQRLVVGCKLAPDETKNRELEASLEGLKTIQCPAKQLSTLRKK